MNYWMTTQWPPREAEEHSGPSGVYLPDGRQEAGADMGISDLILIYECKSGRDIILENVDGSSTRIRCQQGCRGIRSIERIAGPVHQNADIPVTRYADGTEIWWCWYAPTTIVSTNGFVPLAEVNSVLRYSPNCNLRGFGDLHSGLKRLTEHQFETLAQAFKRRRREKQKAPRSKAGQSQRRVGPTCGESDEHRDLKNYVGAKPSEVLAEHGLVTIQVEYAFQTGDCADIVLEDRFGRIIGVEVERYVADGELPGLLQALKYRVMLELEFEAPQGEGRAFLVAHSISDRMRQICKDYGIEYFVIDKSAVARWKQRRKSDA